MSRLPETGVCEDPRKPACFEAECASGVMCGAESGPLEGRAGVVEWMRAHTAETSHLRFFLMHSGYVYSVPLERQPLEE